METIDVREWERRALAAIDEARGRWPVLRLSYEAAVVYVTARHPLDVRASIEPRGVLLGGPVAVDAEVNCSSWRGNPADLADVAHLLGTVGECVDYFMGRFANVRVALRVEKRDA